MIYSCGRLQSDTNLEAVFFFLRNNHVVFSIIQHWLSSLLYSGLSQTFKNSVCTCCFSDRQRHYIFLTCMGLPNPYFLICHGALGEEVVVLCRIVSIYWLDYLDGPQIWLTSSFIQDTSPLLSWSYAGAGDCALLGNSALPAGGPPPQILAYFSKTNWSPPWWCR